MSKNKPDSLAKTNNIRPASSLPAAALLSMAFATWGISAPSSAVQFQVDEVDVNWTNTFKYSLGTRLTDPTEKNLANPNADDPDQNFEQGSLIMNRFDWLSEFSARWQNIGLNLSGAAWYDNVYNQSNDNKSPSSFNPYSVEHDHFTEQTEKWAGKKIELMNAFVSGQFTPLDVPVSMRLGQHTLIWGESLFITDNGVAAGMAPVDAYKALSVPNIKAQEVFLPTNQLSLSVLLSDSWVVEGYYQFEWEKTRIPPVGSYLSSVDILDEGGERIIAGAGTFFYRGADKTPDAAQYGLSVRWRPVDLNLDMGVYALRYNDKTPRVNTILSGGFDPVTGSIGEYYLDYKEHIDLYGVSANMSFGALNLGGEVSYRNGVALRAAGDVLTPDVLGNTLHAQLSAVWVGNAGVAWDGVSIAAELAGHRLLEVTKNEQQRDTTLDDSAYGIRGVTTFKYFQVLPSLDVEVPIGLGYNFKGKSPISAAFNNYGGNEGGDITVGVVGTYQQAWTIGVNATHFFGSESSNYYSGRDFLMASVSRSF
ncbi:DUF1302 family protein [Pseudomonas putida]|uniref:DUF1302 domain-containing protein n=1 Tax=Pseudomonas putida TaxID=303 RepID=UPI00227110C4|nr:DUF1302 family protein [Pseudomonas putida]WAB99242.1 DUF1302 family protein [Pseudomonas putida]